MPFPGNIIPANRFSQISREVLNLATMRPDLPGVRNNFVYTPGDAISTNPWNKFSVKLDHNLTMNDRLGFLFHWGEVLVHSAERRSRWRPAGASQQLPRRRLAHLRVSSELGSRDQSRRCSTA